MVMVAGRSGRSVHVTEQQPAELRSRLDGPVLRPGEPGWDASVMIWNGIVQTADEGGDRIRDTYCDNVDRLIDIKNKYDPHGLFRVNRNIAPRAAL